jgi:hypothetical protein
MIRLPVKFLKSLVFTLVFISLSNSTFSFQNHIGGIINKYASVKSIGADNVIVDDLSQFSPGDTALIIQMKGILFYGVESGAFGNYHDSIGKPGECEFLIVKSTESLLKRVTFTHAILKNYKAEGIVQLIKVPYYKKTTVTSTLSCQPWDSVSKKGGILAFTVGGTLSLEADIDVTGKGFVGGAISQGTGMCTVTDPLYDKFSYPESFTNSGFKGESNGTRVFLAFDDKRPVYPGYAKGKGSSFTGGGGGNGRYSGGGGGSNYGSGGRGGMELIACFPNDGGLGGRTVKFTDIDGGIFLGGGGGSSTYESASSATAGANGGGIIIIICDTLKGNGNVIKADGNTTAGNAGGNAGAGGGGGGGSVVVSLKSYSTKLTESALSISANGGKGGNTLNNFGEGGGGGGGLILTNNIVFPTNVIINVNGGSGGTRLPGIIGSGGTFGEKLTSFAPILNGFLFNSIRSSVNGNQIDNIDSGQVPPVMTGTKPVGGIPPYTYKWEKSYNGITWASLVNDPVPENYIPSIGETTAVYFRRIVMDSSIPAITDFSIPVKITISITSGESDNVADKPFIIYPNPARNSFEVIVKDNNSGILELMLYDINGKLVSSVSTQKTSGDFSYRFNVPELPQGLYFLRLFLNHEYYSSKRVVLIR